MLVKAKKNHPMKSLLALSALTIALSASNSLAAANKSTQDSSKSDFKQSVTGTLDISRSTSLYDKKDGSREDGADLVAKLNFAITPNYVLILQGGYSEDLKNSEKSDFSDTSFVLARKKTLLGKYISFAPTTTLIAPTSKKSHTQDNLIAGARIGGVFAMNPEIDPNAALSLSLSGGQNFHTYDTSINGAVLNKYSFTQTLTAGYSWGDFSAGFVFIHKNAWTYQGTLLEAFEHSEELGYAINERYSLALGHTNAGSALKANGLTNNISLVNEDSSLAYITLTVNF